MTAPPVAIADAENAIVKTVSIFANATATAPKDCSAAALTRAIQAGKWRAAVEPIRTRYAATYADALARGDDREAAVKAAKRAVGDLKKALPAVAFSGTFSYRASANLLGHSGLLCADLDDLDAETLARCRARLASDPHVWSVFTSPTGSGLKAVFRVPADAGRHSASFAAVRDYVLAKCDVEIDEACKDLARLCFVSDDLDATLNENAVELPVAYLAEPAAPKPPPKAPAAARDATATAPDLAKRLAIARELFGEPDTTTKPPRLLVKCPGISSHTNGDAPTDCELHLDGAPNLSCLHNSCRAAVETANHELQSRIGKAEYSAPHGNFGSMASEWLTPKPLPADLPAVQPFDFACLPGTLRPWLEDIAERMQCPPDYPAVGAIIALGSIVGRKVGIRPKRQDDWLIVPNLWGMAVGRPGLMKTPALEQALAPLNRLAAEAMEKYEAKSEEHAVSTLLDDQRAKLAEKAIFGLLKGGNEAAARELATANLQNTDTAPVLRRFKVNDPTVEKLGELLNENPNGLLLHRDELVGFLKSLDKEGREDSRAFFLEAWNGTGDFTSDRIGRGTVRIEAVTVSILGAIQPGPLSDYLRQAVRCGAGDDGLLQRFQLAVWPDTAKEWRNVDRWPDTKAKNDAFEIFCYLDTLSAAALGADTADRIPFLRFSPGAQDRFDVWRAELEKILRSDCDHPAFEAHLAKYRKLVPALALVLHLANRDTGPVTLAALEQSLLWANYLESHARRIYSAVLRPDAGAARELAKHLQRGDLPAKFTLRETYRKGWTGLASKEDAEAATEILCDLGWIRPAYGSAVASGRPASPTFETHPLFSEPPAKRTDKTDTTPLGEVLAVSSVTPAPCAESFSAYEVDPEPVPAAPAFAYHQPEALLL